MSGKLSERLEEMVSRGGERTAPVKVRLRAGLSEKQVKNAVRKLASRLGGAEYLSISGTVHGRMALDAAASVSGLPEVEWIDVEKEVPLEDLIDPA
jgi:hypothetical protein